MVRIGFGMRLVAALIDCAIMMGLMFALNATVLAVMGLSVASAIVAGTVSCIAALALSSLEVFKAASVGKMLLKFRITMADGSDAPTEVLVKRWLIKQSPTLIALAAALTTLGFLNYIGMLAGLAIFVGCFMALQPDKLAYHDKLLGTAVHGPSTMQVGFPVMTQAAAAPMTQAQSVN
jgi:uncharacterized RDD family membrane protein YckC